MMKTNELIAEISDRPVGERAKIAEAILNTLNQPSPDIEAAWMEEVTRRAKEVESGEIEMIPGKQVMKEMKDITG
jgi:putative addiction module component (TIGR02574 family)